MIHAGNSTSIRVDIGMILEKAINSGRKNSIGLFKLMFSDY